MINLTTAVGSCHAPFVLRQAELFLCMFSGRPPPLLVNHLVLRSSFLSPSKQFGQPSRQARKGHSTHGINHSPVPSLAKCIMRMRTSRTAIGYKYTSVICLHATRRTVSAREACRVLRTIGAFTCRVHANFQRPAPEARSLASHP